MIMNCKPGQDHDHNAYVYNNKYVTKLVCDIKNFMSIYRDNKI